MTFFNYNSDLFHTSKLFTLEMESPQLLIDKNLNLFNERTKPTSAYKICEFILCVKKLLHVSATFVVIFREVMYEGCFTKTSQPMHKYIILSFKYMV